MTVDYDKNALLSDSERAMILGGEGGKDRWKLKLAFAKVSPGQVDGFDPMFGRGSPHAGEKPSQTSSQKLEEQLQEERIQNLVDNTARGVLAHALSDEDNKALMKQGGWYGVRSDPKVSSDLNQRLANTYGVGKGLIDKLASDRPIKPELREEMKKARP